MFCPLKIHSIYRCYETSISTAFQLPPSAQVTSTGIVSPVAPLIPATYYSPKVLNAINCTSFQYISSIQVTYFIIKLQLLEDKGTSPKGNSQLHNVTALGSSHVDTSRAEEWEPPLFTPPAFPYHRKGGSELFYFFKGILWISGFTRARNL